MRGREYLTRSVARLGLSGRQASAAVEAFWGGVAGALSEGRDVSLVGFGAWEWVERPARRAHDPRDLRPVELPDRKKLAFRPSERLKRRIREGER